MLKDLFQNRLFIGALAFFVLCVGGRLLYQQHVKREVAEQAEMFLEAKEPPKPKVRTPILDTSQGGHFHADGTWHAEPHDPSSEVAPVKPVTRRENSSQKSSVKWAESAEQMPVSTSNPPPFQNVPVDLYDFEATKAAMIENINFVKANWDPKVFDPEVQRADATTCNISNAALATQLGLFTREQALELRALRMNLLTFQGVEHGRVQQLYSEGYTREEAQSIAIEETKQRQNERWGVK